MSRYLVLLPLLTKLLVRADPCLGAALQTTHAHTSPAFRTILQELCCHLTSCDVSGADKSISSQAHSVLGLPEPDPSGTTTDAANTRGLMTFTLFRLFVLHPLVKRPSLWLALRQVDGLEALELGTMPLSRCLLEFFVLAYHSSS